MPFAVWPEPLASLAPFPLAHAATPSDAPAFAALTFAHAAAPADAESLTQLQARRWLRPRLCAQPLAQPCARRPLERLAVWAPSDAAGDVQR